MSLLTMSSLPLLASKSLAADESTSASSLEPFKVLFTVQTDAKQNDTSEIEIEVRPDWAPIAAARFKELVESGFYNDSRFVRVLPGFVAQFGIAADPKLNKEWILCEKSCRALPDEPRAESNKRGTLSFASSGKNSRQTQVRCWERNDITSRNYIPVYDYPSQYYRMHLSCIVLFL